MLCHGCQELMLEHLYDLLEGAEQSAFLAHLEGCPACQASLASVRSQQQLLARAALREFPDVQFAPPQEPETLPLPVKRKPRRWIGYAAATLFLAMSTLVFPAQRLYQEHSDALAIVTAQDATIAEARMAEKESRNDLLEALARRNREQEKVFHEINARELRLVVTGPRNVQSGAPAEFQVETRDLNGNPADAEVDARLANLGELGKGVAPTKSIAKADSDKVSDQKSDGITVHRQAVGSYKVTIPPTVRLEPNQTLDMLVSARKKGGLGRDPLTLSGKVQLSTPVYLTHLTTDKPMYQPGEVVRFRSLTLERQTLRPASDDLRLLYTIQTPKGDTQIVGQGSTHLWKLDGSNKATVANGPNGKPIRGVGAGEFALDPNTGGEYTLTLTEEGNRFQPVTRKFTVNSYQKPRLDKKLDFNRSSYGPGDEVQARVVALRADGGPLKRRPVDVKLVIDDQQYDAKGQPSRAAWRLETDDDGSALVQFTLSRQIQRGQASLAVTFDDGGSPEPLVRTVPIVLKKLNVEFYPEGGDLVAGLPSRVYFQARTPAGKPAQLRGTILENNKPIVAVATFADDQQPGVNQGNGVFSLTPRPNAKYSLRIDSPAGIAETKPLPQVKADGVVLNIPRGVFQANDSIAVTVATSQARTLTIGAYCRGQLLDLKQLGRVTGQTDTVLVPQVGTGGVCRVTVFEEVNTGGTQRELRPIAERLIYRQPRERVDVSIVADQRRYLPGQKANLSLIAVNEKEKFTPTLVMLKVVDRSVVTLADEKTYRSMPTHFMLTTEVRRPEDLEHADFLVGSHAKAAESLDALLGTQGWRRFAEQSPERARQRLIEEAERLPENERLRQLAEAERLMVLIGQSVPQQTDFDQDKILRIEEEFTDKQEAALAKHEQATEIITRAKSDEYNAALAVLARHGEMWDRLRAVGMPILSLLLGVLVLAGLINMQARESRRGWVYGGLTAGVGVAMVLLMAMPTGYRVEHGKDQAEVQGLARADLSDALLRNLARAEFEGAKGDKDAAGNHLGGGTGAMVAAPAIPGMPPPMMPFPGGLGGIGMLPRPTAGRLMLPADDKKQAEHREKAFAFNAELKKRGALARNFGGDGKGLPLGQDGYFRERPNAVFRRALPELREARKGKEAKELDVGQELPLLVREYAHKQAESKQNVREDFRETLFWHPVLVLEDGKADVSFELCDSVTTFEVTAYAHTLDGRLGSTTKTIESRLPFTLAPRVPMEVTATDRIDLPVAISNNTSESRQVEVKLDELSGLALIEGNKQTRLGMSADTRAKRIYPLRPTVVSGTASVQVEGRADGFHDAIRETIRVVPDGFPVSGSSSDLLEKSATHKLTLPTWVPGTLTCKVDVYPSTLSDLQQGLEGLLREPHGCFEQSSTANYPNVLILDYLRTKDKANPALEQRTRQLLQRGYQKLTSFECLEPGKTTRRGYEWFGGSAPPHEALTAYGLLQFRDMAKVHDVDKQMLARTREYLMAQRDGRGGFRRNDRAIDTFGGAPEHVTNAYIVWALTESGEREVATELKTLLAVKSEDAYFLSLVANSLANVGRGSEAEAILKRVAKTAKTDGHLEAQTSITGSGGVSLQIETTALAMLGWLKTNPTEFAEPIARAARWIGQQRGGSGAFGSTQSTILALKALIAHARENKRTPEAGELRLYVGEERVAEMKFAANVTGTMTLSVKDAEKKLKVGENKVRVEITGAKNMFPHTVSWECRTAKPTSSKDCPVELTTTLSKALLTEGEVTRVNVKVHNRSGQPQGMVVAIVGLPGGMILPEDLKQLKEHCQAPAKGKQPLVSAFEVKGRELVLYWRGMAKDQVIEVPIDVVARVPGIYRGPASRAYLYYNAEKKDWQEPLLATIRVRK